MDTLHHSVSTLAGVEDILPSENCIANSSILSSSLERIKIIMIRFCKAKFIHPWLHNYRYRAYYVYNNNNVYMYMYLSHGLSSSIFCFPVASTMLVLVCSLKSIECFGDSSSSSDLSELSSLSSSSGSKLEINVKGDQELIQTDKSYNDAALFLD